MSEQRFEDELEEPADPLEDDSPQNGEPWAKTSSGDAEDVTPD